MFAGSPIPYESLRAYFQSDPASSWGAYVTGCLLVLAREKGARFPDGISILVASDVPEGVCVCLHPHVCVFCTVCEHKHLH